MSHGRFDGGSLLAYFALLACTGTSSKRPSVEARPACETVAYQTIRITTREANAGQSATTDTRGRAPKLNLSPIIRLEGAGARCVRGFKEGYFLMAHGAVYKLERRGYLVERDRTASPFARTGSQAGPAFNSKLPQSFASLNEFAPNSRRIAVWNLSAGSLVGVLSPGAISDEVNFITRSDLILRDINYASGLDTPTGLVTLIHEIDPETVEVLGGVLNITG